MQVYVVMAVKAVTTAFLVWQKEQAPIQEAGEQTSWSMYRRKLKAFNRNKLIVFTRPSFSIFFSHEVFVLAGLHVHDTEKELNISQALIYTRWTGLTHPESSWYCRSFHFAQLCFAQFFILGAPGIRGIRVPR